LMIYIPAEVDAASLHDSRTIVTIQNSVLPWGFPSSVQHCWFGTYIVRRKDKQMISLLLFINIWKYYQYFFVHLSSWPILFSHKYLKMVSGYKIKYLSNLFVVIFHFCTAGNGPVLPEFLQHYLFGFCFNECCQCKMLSKSIHSECR
jgi:hypothetical protein